MAAVIDIGAARAPLDYARRYARIGWHVFPVFWIEQLADGTRRCACGDDECKSPGKHPISHLVPRGQSDATVDPARIDRWWAAAPRAHIGVFLAPSSLIAIDIDPRNGGNATIDQIERAHGPLVSDVTQLTGGGGEHRVFSLPGGMQAQLPGKLGPGVDVKANGYIVVEPSGHLSGGVYVWEASSDPLDGCIPSPLPDWLRSMRPATPLPAGTPLAAGTPLPAGTPLAATPLPAHQVLEVQSALWALDPNDRDNWLKVGMALHSTGAGPQAYGMWAEWARQSDKFDARDQARVWASFSDSRGLDGIKLTYVFAQAQAAGWVNPQSNAARVVAMSNEPKAAPLRAITAAAFRLRDPSTIEPRDWLYKRIFIRGYVTGTFAPGAAAKTQMSLFDMVTMACGFDLATREPLRRGPLTVWYINVEDDREEIERRLAAICLHYRITDADLAGRLLVDTDREGRYLVAETTRHGVVVQEVVVSAILEQVKAHKVDLVVADPLVGMHAVSENSNPEMNRVIAQLRRVAEQGNCGVHVVHHVRKGGDGEEVSAEDGRGASAIKDACRAIRTITPMSEKEAADFGISPERRRFYIWANPSGKPNLAPPVTAREWFMLEDVGLGNGRADRDEDRIGVPVKWSPPSAFDGISLDDCRRIWVVVGSISAPLTEARANAQSPAWLGWRVLKTLGWAASDIQSVSQIKRLLSSWLMGSVLEEYRVSDGQKGRDVPCLRLGPAAKLD